MAMGWGEGGLICVISDIARILQQIAYHGHSKMTMVLERLGGICMGP